MNRVLLILVAVGGVTVITSSHGKSAPPVSAPNEASAGAPRVDGRFVNHVEPSERPSLRVTAELWARKLWTSLVPRPGAAPLVRYDRAAMEISPSLTWIGHSTFLVRMDGVTFLTDPMFSDRAGPVSFAGPRRAVPPGVPLGSLPRPDFVLLSHDHYDHADRPTVQRLARQGVRFVVPLGLGQWIRNAGGKAIELDWGQRVEMDGVTIDCVPAQHFSGRSLRDGGESLWAGWIVSGPTRRFYHAGDTGYSADFTAIGQRFGHIDLAAVPIGAYRPEGMMHYVHTTPEEALRLALDVRARRVVAMHFGTFDLADEPLDEPPRRFRSEAERLGLGPDRTWVLQIGETRQW